MMIVQAIAGAERGGAEGFFFRLVPALAAAGVVQHALIRDRAENRDILARAGVPATALRFGGPLDLAGRWRLRRLLRQLAPDLVLTWMSRATAHCPPGRGRFVKVARLGGYYDLKYYRDCDHLVGNTQALVDYMRAGGWPAERTHHLPNFVDAGGAPLDRAAFDTPPDVPLVLSAGRLHPVKGFDLLLRALAAVPQAHLWLAGTGPEEAALKRLASALGLDRRVRFLGWRGDMGTLMASADLVVCPSRQEAFGNVVAEAWAAGRPVVASAAPGPAALIRDGANGLLVPVADVAALAAAMTRVLAAPDLAARLAEGGRASFARDFAAPTVVARWQDFLARIAAAPRPRQ